MNMQAMGIFKPITALYLSLYIKPRIFTKRQYKLKWLDPSHFCLLTASVHLDNVRRTSDGFAHTRIGEGWNGIEGQGLAVGIPDSLEKTGALVD